jgi:hypothetical protein
VPAVLHITHWKAGSSWIRRILRRLDRERFQTPSRGWDPFPEPIPHDCLYSCYATREQVEAAHLPPHHRFIVVRDLRDTLVSAYFSFRETHQPSEIVEPLRRRLLALDKEEGMIYLMDEFMPRCVAIQESWRGEPVIHYEDLLQNDVEILKRVLLDDCGLDVPEPRFERIVRSQRFRQVTGRARGEESAEHLRKGVAGDWRNHFTDRIRDEFDQRFGSMVRQ